VILRVCQKREVPWNPLDLPLHCNSIIIIIIAFPKQVHKEFSTRVGTIVDQKSTETSWSSA